MKIITSTIAAAILSTCLGSTLAQALPGAPEDNGLAPKSNTVYINEPDPNHPEIINNNGIEAGGVAIANNGNVIVGWEDDGDGVTDQEGVWTLLDSNGTLLTPATEVTSLALGGESGITSFLSYFRADGSAVAPNASWGPKIKANLFGDGVGMGSTSFTGDEGEPNFEAEVAAFANFGDGGDFPTVQLLSNDGQPLSIDSGLTDDYADSPGDVRIGDWEYLSNGNIVIVGESRQKDDLVTKYGGDVADTHPIYRVLDSTGKEVKAESLVSDTPVGGQMWHGSAVTKNGFAIRWDNNNASTVRLFKNDGTPLSTNIDIAALTGKAATATTDRGEKVGFQGNGNHSYVISNSGTDEDGNLQVWVTVLNDDGTVKYSRAVTDDLVLIKPGATDAAIDPAGRVIVVFSDASGSVGGTDLVMGRMFDPNGTPLGGTFYVSEIETPDAAFAPAIDPRIFWRAGLVAITWVSNNGPTGVQDVALRTFTTFAAGSAEGAGLTRIVADTPVILPAADSLGNWEPYSSVLGNSVFLIEANTFAKDASGQDLPDQQRYVVMAQPVDGGKPAKLGEGFYADDGTPFNKEINGSRNNGNPGRVAGDKRPGAANFIVGGETSAHAIPAFNSDNRFDLGFDYQGASLDDSPNVSRYGTIQTFKLDPSTLDRTPLMKAIDSANGRLTSGTVDSPGDPIQNTRFGGELAGLDNGNFVSVVEDRTSFWNPNGHAVVATIIAPDGTIVKDTWKVADGDIWSNVAAYKGGFAVRATGVIYFYDNAGNLKGQIDQKPPAGNDFPRDRGDGSRIASHINSPYVFLAGVINSLPNLAVYDSRDFSFVTVAAVSELGFAGAWDRIGLAVDALNRVVVGGVVTPPGYVNQQVAARVVSFDSNNKTITPLTPSFFAFINVSPGDINTLQMNPAMTTKQILIAAKGQINLENKPDQGVDSPKEVNFYTVLSHPDPKDDPTTPVSNGGTRPQLTIARTGANVNLTWDLDGFTLQSAPAVTGAWTTVNATGKSYSSAASGTLFFRLTKP